MMWEKIETPSVVAEATRLRGDITFSSGAHIFGIVEGDLTQQSVQAVHIGKTGWVHGSVKSQGPVLIEGRVDGHVQATHKIVLSPTATVRGSLTAPGVEIRPGAIVEGEVVMAGIGSRRSLTQAA